MSYNANDYVQVAERRQEFFSLYPNGSIQGEIEFLRDEDGAVFGLLYKAFAYREPEDIRPGVGMAYEPFPGKTNFTRESEVQNAETSAWGRAILAASPIVSKKIASLDEVQNRSGAAPTTTDSVEGSQVRQEAPAAPDNPAAQAQAAMEAAKESRRPQDDGAAENVILSFGKHKGSNLGAVPRAYLEWLTSNFEAKNAEQRRVLTAAHLILNGPGLSAEDDGIPF